MSYTELSTYRNCVEQINLAWPRFRDMHRDRLRHGNEAEKVAEGILEDLFTSVLDWCRGDLAYQTGYADIVLSHNLAKYLVIEAKRPGALARGRRALELALQQARRYADEQKITRIAVSDGCILYAADLENGNLKDRLFADLTSEQPPPGLWWISVHGIYRSCESVEHGWQLIEHDPATADQTDLLGGLLLHHKYKLPAHCFAYVGDANNTHTWKLPYRLADGQVDCKRMPKAIQSLLSNYRGAKVGGIPEPAIPEILKRLASAAAAEGHLPPKNPQPAPVYQQLLEVLEQLGISIADL
ncbi:MAG: hypothetical protein ACRETQ_09550 [Gammaproteobacteria bacterium]